VRTTHTTSSLAWLLTYLPALPCPATEPDILFKSTATAAHTYCKDPFGPMLRMGRVGAPVVAFLSFLSFFSFSYLASFYCLVLNNKMPSSCDTRRPTPANPTLADESTDAPHRATVLLDRTWLQTPTPSWHRRDTCTWHDPWLVTRRTAQVVGTGQFDGTRITCANSFNVPFTEFK
jgi:hypothetical protein